MHSNIAKGNFSIAQKIADMPHYGIDAGRYSKDSRAPQNAHELLKFRAHNAKCEIQIRGRPF